MRPMSEEEALDRMRDAVWSAAFGAAFASRTLQAAELMREPGTAHRGAVEAALRKTAGIARMARTIADAAQLAAMEQLT